MKKRIAKLTGILITLAMINYSCKEKSFTPYMYDIVTTDTVKMPGGWFPEINLNVVDCNSPCWWKSDTFYMLNSAADAWKTFGENYFNLPPSWRTKYTTESDGYRWIESIYQDKNGTLYGWYHQEPTKLIPEEVQITRERRLTAPHIGGCVSYDNGETWTDLGIILNAPEESWNLNTKNHYFAGGHGDFTVLADENHEYFYFIYSSYVADSTMQGICLARLSFNDKDFPVGKVQKLYNGKFSEPGLGGKNSPVYPSKRDWHSARPDVYWGASIHYNTYLKKYVLLMNRAIDIYWKQEGTYMAFADDLSNAESFSEPERIIEGRNWYPQIIGMDFSKQETDRRAGKSLQLFTGGISTNKIVFK